MVGNQISDPENMSASPLTVVNRNHDKLTKDYNQSIIQFAYGRCTFARSVHFPKIPGNQVHNDYSSDSRPEDEED